ncbi:MAG: NAD-dependent epimerase/dehydratase family protein [Chloroflexota bacterium]|nr:NAD-dependent epimerase/dehydratase family protein [Chloroflexota bacterium]
MKSVVGVTGASGYIGRAFARKAKSAGWTVVALGRRAALNCEEWRPCDLRQIPAPLLLERLDAIVHLAADTGKDQMDPTAQIKFAQHLFNNGANKGLRMIFVSSQAASSRAPSDYGRIKAAIESELLPLGVTVLRPGLVYGGEPIGLYGMLRSFVDRSPFIPVFRPKPVVRPIHVDDVATAIVNTLDDRGIAGRVLSLGGEAIPFDEFLRAIAVRRVRRRRLSLPIPTALVRAVLQMLGRVLGPVWSPSRLDSLIRLPVMHPDADLAQLGLSPRALRDGFGPGGADGRALLTEAMLMLRASAGRGASLWTARGYVRILRNCGVGTPLRVPLMLRAFPILLASIDRHASRASSPVGSPVWRQGVALRLAETDRFLAGRFLMTKERAGFWRVFAGLARGIVMEVVARTVSPFVVVGWEQQHDRTD